MVPVAVTVFPAMVPAAVIFPRLLTLPALTAPPALSVPEMLADSAEIEPATFSPVTSVFVVVFVVLS